MSRVSRCVLFLAGIVFAAANGFGATAPGLEVIVTSDRSVVFEGITDAEGRFATTPLPPGIYTFEVRVPKTIGTESRYFLALSGAKPITQPLMRRDVAIMMDAQVRSVRSVRGQVTARHVTILTPPASAAPGANPAAAPVANRRIAAPRVTAASPAPVARAPAAATTPAGAAPSAYQQRVINGRLHVWQPLAPGSRLGRWVPEQPVRVGPAAATVPSPRVAPTVTPSRAATASPAVAAQRRIINGKWHVWQPAGPGSTAGAWVPEQPANVRASAPSSVSRTYAPAAPRRIIDGKWHVWQPTAPGSTAGRWVPEQPGGARAVAQPASSPTPTPIPTPTRSGRSSPPRR